MINNGNKLFSLPVQVFESKKIFEKNNRVLIQNQIEEPMLKFVAEKNRDYFEKLSEADDDL